MIFKRRIEELGHADDSWLEKRDEEDVDATTFRTAGGEFGGSCYG